MKTAKCELVRGFSVEYAYRYSWNSHRRILTCDYLLIILALYVKLEVHGRARRETARRRKSECKVNLGNRKSSRSNSLWQMTTKTVSQNHAWRRCSGGGRGGGTFQGAAFWGAKIWNSENWPFLANWCLHRRTGWFVVSATAHDKMHSLSAFLPPFPFHSLFAFPGACF